MIIQSALQGVGVVRSAIKSIRQRSTQSRWARVSRRPWSLVPSVSAALNAGGVKSWPGVAHSSHSFDGWFDFTDAEEDASPVGGWSIDEGSQANSRPVPSPMEPSSPRVPLLVPVVRQSPLFAQQKSSVLDPGHPATVGTHALTENLEPTPIGGMAKRAETISRAAGAGSRVLPRQRSRTSLGDLGRDASVVADGTQSVSVVTARRASFLSDRGDESPRGRGPVHTVTQPHIRNRTLRHFDGSKGFGDIGKSNSLGITRTPEPGNPGSFESDGDGGPSQTNPAPPRTADPFTVLEPDGTLASALSRISEFDEDMAFALKPLNRFHDAATSDTTEFAGFGVRPIPARQIATRATSGIPHVAAESDSSPGQSRARSPIAEDPLALGVHSAGIGLNAVMDEMETRLDSICRAQEERLKSLIKNLTFWVK